MNDREPLHSAEKDSANKAAKVDTRREQEKKQRLARALRDNLLRRKAFKTKE